MQSIKCSKNLTNKPVSIHPDGAKNPTVLGNVPFNKVGFILTEGMPINDGINVPVALTQAGKVVFYRLIFSPVLLNIRSGEKLYLSKMSYKF